MPTEDRADSRHFLAEPSLESLQLEYIVLRRAGDNDPYEVGRVPLEPPLTITLAVQEDNAARLGAMLKIGDPVVPCARKEVSGRRRSRGRASVAF